MSLRPLLDRLPSELARLPAAYLAEACFHDELAAYPTLPSLLERLERHGKRSTEERKERIAMLLRVHRMRPHRVWSTILLHVFGPLLRKIRKKLAGADDDTRTEVVLEHFVEAIRCVPTDDAPRVFMYVRQAVRKRVFAALKDVTAWEEFGFGVEADLEPDPITETEPSLAGVWVKTGGTRPEQAELLATFGDHGGLQAVVERRYPGLDAVGKARAFRCLQKQRQRLVAELRRQVGLGSQAKSRGATQTLGPAKSSRREPIWPTV